MNRKLRQSTRQHNLREKGSSGTASTVQLRPNTGQGPYTAGFRQFIARKVDAQFYEFLREAIPVMDAAIWRLVSLDGFLVVEGNNSALVDEIQDWMESVPVNDLQTGLQAFHQNFSNEAFEQGFTLGEFVANSARTDIIGLRVADSKYIKFNRTPTEMEIWQRADGDLQERKLNTANLLYWSILNENQNPYGTPLFRSCEFVAQVLATMHNSLLNVWERFGDPSFSLVYKTGRKDGNNHKDRCDALAKDLDSVVRAKRLGKSADFVHAIDKDSDIDIKVIGAVEQVLELEIPARHILEQIVSKTGLPPWMLGMHWSTTERLAEFESEMVLADIVTRQSAKLPTFKRVITTLLKMRGRTWKKGDWELKFQQVNLHDVEKQARARFLNAQADMMGVEQETPATKTAYQLKKKTDRHGNGALVQIKADGLDPELEKTMWQILHKINCSSKEIHRTDPWPELDRLEDGYEQRLKDDWSALHDQVKAVLGLGMPEIEKGVSRDSFTFSLEERARVLSAMKHWLGTYKIDDEDSPVNWYYGQSYSLGLIQAANLIGKDRPILDILKNQEILDKLKQEGFDRVKDRATTRMKNKILAEMEAHAIAGTNPINVAERLKRLFGDANSDWERLARSELSMAAERAKGEEWKAWGVETMDFMPAPDACPACLALAGEYKINECPLPVADTHPRCRCARRPGAGVDAAKLRPIAERAPTAEFVAAKTLKDAEQWARDNNLADMVSYKGASVEVANEWNRSVHDHITKFPMLRENLKFIGTTQERQRTFVRLRVDELRKRYPSYSEESLIRVARREAGKTPGNVYAYATKDRLTSGICVNSNWGKTPDKFKEGLASDVAAGFHPVGCDTIRSVVDHEIAHQLDSLLDIRKRDEFTETMRVFFADGGSIPKDLSRYAYTSPAETIAEAWAEYLNNGTPRPLAKKIGNLIESRYKAEFGGES